MYARFADVYDALMDDFDYPAWAAYYWDLIVRSGKAPQTLCDVGCGTGSMTIELARRGLSVTGVDASPDMLEHAAVKARAAGLFIPFICQDMRALSLHRPVDVIVCACDGVNYLLSEADVSAFFAAAHSQLKPGGVLAFDFSTARKFDRMIADKAYCEERDDSAYLWFNKKGEREHTIDMDLTFFVRKPDGLYERFEERQTQRAHRIDQLDALLRKNGFSAVRAYGDRTESAPSSEDDRVHMTAVKQ